MPFLLGYYEHNLSPFLIQFTDTFGIRYYGLAYVTGFIVAGLLLHLYWKTGRSPLNRDGQADLLFWLIAGTMVGGRVGYFIFYTPELLLSRPWELVTGITHGGMSSHGGFVGVMAGAWWAARKHRIPFLAIGDLVATLAPPGLMLGRIANFINGELWGHESRVPWAIRFPIRNEAGAIIAHTVPRHPSQLYEAALEGLLLMLYTQWRIWRTPSVLQTPGRLGGEFLVGYAIVRVIGEFFRQHDEGIEPVLGLNRGAWLSFGILAAGVIAIAWSNRNRPAD